MDEAGLAALSLLSSLIIKLEAEGKIIPKDKMTMIAHAKSIAGSFAAPHGPAAARLLEEFGPLND